jgi:hypothetical protein
MCSLDREFRHAHAPLIATHAGVLESLGDESHLALLSTELVALWVAEVERVHVLVGHGRFLREGLVVNIMHPFVVDLGHLNRAGHGFAWEERGARVLADVRGTLRWGVGSVGVGVKVVCVVVLSRKERIRR